MPRLKLNTIKVLYKIMMFYYTTEYYNTEPDYIFLYQFIIFPVLYLIPTLIL